MNKKLLKSMLLTTLLLFLLPASSALAANTVQVTLPTFDVTLNGQTTSNAYSKHPLIVYKDITYFPMTYYDCRLLGLKTTWTMEDGLGISKNDDYFYEYARDINNQKNAEKQRATIANGKITVNGTIIDNSKEEYPLLLFRDVTYFPLTWRFAVDEFDWLYSFDHENGLMISNDAVKLENPEQWSEQFQGYIASMYDFYEPFTVSDVYPRTGTYSKTMIYSSSSSIEFYNPTKHDVQIKELPPFQYRISKTINNHNELVYWKLSPNYIGDMKAYSLMSYDFGHEYLLNASPGTYQTELIIPEVCTYQIATFDETLYGPIRIWGPNFNSTATIQLTK